MEQLKEEFNLRENLEYEIKSRKIVQNFSELLHLKLHSIVIHAPCSSKLILTVVMRHYERNRVYFLENYNSVRKSIKFQAKLNRHKSIAQANNMNNIFITISIA